MLESIKAQANGNKGSFISSAVMTTSVYDSKGIYLGGFACEYSGSGTRSEAEKSLEVSIAGIIERRKYGSLPSSGILYKDTKTSLGYTIHPGKIFVYDSMRVKKHHGSVFTAICFISYHYPLLTKNSKKENSKKKTKKKKK